MLYRINSKKESGFTLLEVLVAILVFSFGLLGIAGMMTISVRNNHNGYLRTQASFFADNIMDRMRANPVGVWEGAYNGTAADGGDVCTLGSPCNYITLSNYDTQSWARSIAATLPGGQGSINCVGEDRSVYEILEPTEPPSIWFPAPPYNGLCTITITWNESSRNSATDMQTLTLVGQP